MTAQAVEECSGEVGRQVSWRRNETSEYESARTISFSEKPIGCGRRRLADWINPTGEKKVHSLVHKLGTVTGEPTLGTGHSRLSETNIFFEPPLGKLVKAVCGKTARTVWAADGGEPLNGRLLRLDVPVKRVTTAEGRASGNINLGRET